VRGVFEERAAADGYGVAASREDFFERCDVISLHLRLVNATRGMWAPPISPA
jgi:D-3-phosphoglycerate dehydrogenase